MWLENEAFDVVISSTTESDLPSYDEGMTGYTLVESPWTADDIQYLKDSMAFVSCVMILFVIIVVCKAVYQLFNIFF